MEQDRQRWDARYAAADRSLEIRPEAEWLVPSMASYLQPDNTGSRPLALDLACGKGGASLFLASIGYDVVALDVSIEALKICQRHAHQHQLPVFPVVMDLDHVGIGQGRCNLVSVIRYLNRDLFPQLLQVLAPGGLLFYKTFNLNHLKSKPGFNRDFVLEPGELQHVFAALEILQCDESGASSYLMARKPD